MTMPPVQLAFDDRAAWVSLPFIGEAYAARSPTNDFGYVLEMEHKVTTRERTATLWAGPWEIIADSTRRRGLIPAMMLLMAMALLKAVVWPDFRVGRRRRGNRSR